ncbi:MAG: hypothetical protein GEU71_08600 [Actinobacteria bacterium]|nr:hypothetical protein [Actinomycetota bacterium]
MAKLKLISATASHRGTDDRDIELRRAQEKAFDEVRLARTDSAREFAMGRAVAELIDACERYISEAPAVRF